MFLPPVMMPPRCSLLPLPHAPAVRVERFAIAPPSSLKELRNAHRARLRPGAYDAHAATSPRRSACEDAALIAARERHPMILLL